jgi:adenylate kinase family enzyme
MVGWYVSVKPAQEAGFLFLALGIIFETRGDMKKIVVLGKPGNGKSSLAERLGVATGLPVHQLDSIFYKPNGETIDVKKFERLHETIIAKDSWIIEGFGTHETLYQRLRASDTSIYIDLPYLVSYWFVTKRLFKGMLIKPEGWPEGCSVLKGSIQSYKTLRGCPAFWNNEFMEKVEDITVGKSLHVIRTVPELDGFIDKYVSA